MTVPILETERIILRPLRADDAPEVYDNWARDPDVTRFMRWTAHKSIDETAAWLASVEASAEKGGDYSWGFVLKEGGVLFGTGGLSFCQERGMFELGYNIMKKYWNMGLTSEAAKAIVDFAADALGADRIFAVHAKENGASGRVLEKLGFIYQNDCISESFDGRRTFQSREYLLTISRGGRE